MYKTQMSYTPIRTYNRKGKGKEGTLDRLVLGGGGAGDERARLEEEELRLVSTMVLLVLLVSDPNKAFAGERIRERGQLLRKISLGGFPVFLFVVVKFYFSLGEKKLLSGGK